MSHKSLLFLAIAALVVASLGCKITLDLPVKEISTGTLRTEQIQVDSPDAEIVDVELAFGAGELSIAPGAGLSLISGEATYNVDDFKPKISVEDNRVRLETGNLEINGIPNFKKMDSLKNQWDLALGNKPMNLVIQAGAYQGNYELGGLALKNLDISDGAADVSLKFSQPNLTPMDSMRYTTGASKVNLFGLGFANFSSMIFRSGAGDYTLDFSGGLQRDSVVTIESGVSQVTVIAPRGMNAKVVFKGGLATIDASGSWEKSGDQYVLAGDGPTLTINVDMGAGNLKLQTTN